MRIPRTAEEIEDQMQWAAEGVDNGTRYGGMSYEDGIMAALQWVTGETDDKPDAD